MGSVCSTHRRIKKFMLVDIRKNFHFHLIYYYYHYYYYYSCINKYIKQIVGLLTYVWAKRIRHGICALYITCVEF